MEQRIGSNNQPLAAAAVDPSHIPGLTAPVSVKKEKQEEPEDIKPTEPVEPTETEEPDEAAPERDEPAAAEKPSLAKASAERTSADDEADSEDDDTDEDEDAGADSDTPDAEAEEAAEEVTDGPVFEASDRRAKIVADSRGVRLRLDDQECEFGWDEIGAIETESPRLGKRFTVTVHTPDSRWYPIEIEAKAKSEHAAWEKQIDEVLDAYFDEGAEEKEAEAEAEDSAP
ncbi:hypothetical protein [Streptomyces europaeiscabiei]|uniref:hypothetical protein n=1 Tax=Streptomyces europaeiscabiei TaxID=146819 RepID=UPI0029B62BAB|nr:hypothetical protein [Streptomyces europaeiscabiei]MDX3860601.1 hypothetical protein [Streptomyces europaeiscabiei]MDX3869264.1 hypothetical protein [Streptomyces europaeiscabiei]